MTTLGIEHKSAGLGAVQKQTLTRAWVVAIVLALGAISMIVAERVFNRVLVKDPAPLNKPLAELAQKIGPYVAVGEDRKLDAEIVAGLGTEDYLLRQYQDTRKKPGELGSYVSVNLNYYASGSATPHVPDICWAGNGKMRHSDGAFAADNVPHKSGPPSAVRMRWLAFIPDRDPSELTVGQDQNVTRLINVAYVFQVNDGYVSTASEVAKHFWNPKARYAYHTKIELTLTYPNGAPMACEPQEAIPVFAEFLRTALPE
ncbi:MAG: hypothetical protein WCI73_19955, partial [Phycisphaerae bacterium]